MELKQYPQEIAALQRQIFALTKDVRCHQESVTVFLGNIDRQIAFDSDLKNDAQRKARKQELMETDPGYLGASFSLREAADNKAELEIQLELLRNQFALLKLERREAIASMELQASAA